MLASSGTSEQQLYSLDDGSGLTGIDDKTRAALTELLLGWASGEVCAAHELILTLTQSLVLLLYQLPR